MLSEGIGKTRLLGWSAEGYLVTSTGPFSDLFKSIAANPTLLNFSNYAVIYGLIITGCLLLLGLFTRLGCLSGLFLLSLFYLAQPPFSWQPQPLTESNYLIVNRILIEALGLFVVMTFPTGRFAGLDSLLQPIAAEYFPTWLVGRKTPEA